MNFNTENRSGGENRIFYNFVNLLGVTVSDFYKETEDEAYRQAIKDISFEVCKYLEPLGFSLNRTPLTADWLDSNTRKDYRRKSLIK